MTNAAACPDSYLELRTQALLDIQRKSIFRSTDRLFAGLMVFQWLAGIAAAAWIAPHTWIGTTSHVHMHVWAAVLLGGAISLFPIFLAIVSPGAASTRYTIATGQMLMSGLLIHLTGGRIETHFHVFGSLAFLAFYRDWRVFIPATIVVALDHIIRGNFYPQSVFGILTASPWRWLEHAGWVIYEDIFLLVACRRSVHEMRSLAERQARLESTNENIEQAVRERTAALKRAELEYRHLVESAQAIVWRANAATFQFEFVNRIAESVLGYPIEQWTATPDFWREHILPADRDQAIISWLQAAVIQTRAEFECRMVARDGSVVWLRNIVQAIGDREGATELIGVMIDSTAQKRVEEELKRATTVAEAASHSKFEFFAKMSREIITPINGIVTMTEKALATDPTPPQEEYLSAVKTSAESLLDIVGEMRDLARIEAEKVELEPQLFVLGSAIDSHIHGASGEPGMKLPDPAGVPADSRI